MNHKYIVTTTGGWCIFSSEMTHKYVAQSLEGAPAGAGFCELYAPERQYISVRCFGESLTLGIHSRPEDEEIINRALKNEW